jgi:hypothetical protein
MKIIWHITIAALVLLGAGGIKPAQAELRWGQPVKKEHMKVRLVALAWTHQRSSFFANEEIFVAEKELSPGELSLVKLVYGFLPYQPRLSETGFEYSTLHVLRAQRDPSCDETLLQMTEYGGLRYASDSAVGDLERRRTPLACYVTSAEDYTHAVHAPVSQR